MKIWELRRMFFTLPFQPQDSYAFFAPTLNGSVFRLKNWLASQKRDENSDLTPEECDFLLAHAELSEIASPAPEDSSLDAKTKRLLIKIRECLQEPAADPASKATLAAWEKKYGILDKKQKAFLFNNPSYIQTIQRVLITLEKNHLVAREEPDLFGNVAGFSFKDIAGAFLPTLIQYAGIIEAQIPLFIKGISPESLKTITAEQLAKKLEQHCKEGLFTLEGEKDPCMILSLIDVTLNYSKGNQLGMAVS